MSDNRRIFNVTPPVMTHAMIEEIPVIHDGPHLELFYNLILDEVGFKLPDHMRPIAWALADSSIKKLMVIISPGSTKSELCDIVYPTWEIGLDNTTSILGVSSGADLMADGLNAAMSIIEENKIYKGLFDHIKPDKKMGWSSSRGIYVKRQGQGDANPTYVGTGYAAKYITGKHAKILIVDDLHDRENASSSSHIDGVEKFYYNTLLGRQSPSGARILIIGRRWAEDDIYGRLRKSGDWLVMQLSNIRETEELYFDTRIPAGVSCVFNSYNSSPEVEDIKVVYGENLLNKGFFWIGELGTSKYEEVMQVKNNMPEIFETVYQSNPEAAGNRIFNRDDFRDFTIPDSMYIGRNYDSVADYIEKANFDVILQTWDTAMTDDSANDPSVCYTIGLRGCTKNHHTVEPEPIPVPYHFDVYILDENYKRMQMGDLKQEAIDYYGIWRPNYVLVENSVAGIPLVQSLESDGIQVLPIKVQHTSKRGRAVNGAKAGSAQGWAKQGNILIPRRTLSGQDVVWAPLLLTELHDFTGVKGKRDDRVDAIVQAVNFAIDLGVQSRDLPEGWRDKAGIDEKMLTWQKPNNIFAQLPAMYQNVQNPLFGFCGSCKHFLNDYCKLHSRSVVKFGSCPMYNPKDEVSGILSPGYGDILTKEHNDGKKE